MTGLARQDVSLGQRRLVLMSIKPRYWERIQSGSKCFELRRTPVRFSSGDIVVVYASSPSRALVGAFEAKRILRAPKAEIWERYSAYLGVGEEDYFDYFSDVEFATAIEIRRVHSIERIPLSALRSRWPGFRPPQSFMYWGEDHWRHLQFQTSFDMVDVEPS